MFPLNTLIISKMYRKNKIFPEFLIYFYHQIKILRIYLPNFSEILLL